MAIGDVYFFTVDFTSNSPESLYKGFPIKKKYKQIKSAYYSSTLKEPTPEQQFTTDYELLSAQKYWLPFSPRFPREADYLPYTNGDDFIQIPASNNRKGSYLYLDDVDERDGSPDWWRKNLTREKDLYAPPKTLVYANTIFISTENYFNWSVSDLGPIERNPYLSDSVRKWKVLNDPDTQWTPYWYHPTEKRFYPLKNSDILRVLSSTSDFYLTGAKWEKFTGEARDVNLANFTKRQIEILEMQGFSKKEAESIVAENDKSAANGVRPKVVTKPNGSNNNSNSGSSNNPSDSGANTSLTVSLIKKAIIGAYGEASSITANPQMVQIYRDEEGNYKTSPDRFVFTYRPNNIQYSNIGSEWTEIDRVNNTPFVDFRNFKLMKISFEFIVGDSNNLFTSCDGQIALLRKMAVRPEPVVFLGFDQMFTEQLAYPTSTGGSGVEFAIVDMSVSSVQRTRIADSSGASQNLSPNGNINRATINMTLQELPINKQQLYKLPKLMPDKIIPTIPGIEVEPCKTPISGAAFQTQYGVSRKKYCAAATKP